MATRLFLHAAANALSGTFPTAEQSTTFSARFVADGGDTLRTMDSLTGVSQTELIVSTSSSSTYQVFWGHFCSAPLAGDQTIGAGAQELTLNIGRRVSSGAASATAVCMNLYVWRPSTGAKVGTVYDGFMNPTGLNGGITQRVFNATISAAASVAALDGDVLIVEAWQSMKPSNGLARAIRMFYDGEVVAETQSSTSSNHAAFLNFAADTLAFQQPPATGSFAQSLDDATLSGAGTSPRNGAFSNTLATLALNGQAQLIGVGSFNNTLGALSLTGSGTVADAATTGTFDNTLAAATLAGAGTSPRNGVFNNALAAATLSGAGTSPRNGAFSNTLASVTLTGSAQLLVAGAFDNPLAAATLAATGAIASDTVTGGFDNALDVATLSSAGHVLVDGASTKTLADATLVGEGAEDTPIPVPIVQDDSAGSGAATRTGDRKKFVVPSVEQVPYVDRMFDDLKRQPMPQVVETPKLVPRSTLLADSLAKMAPTLAPTPAPTPVAVEEAEPDDDSDMIMIAMLL